MKNLDWGKISNDRDFQRLVNDLFALEINNPAFLSSNPEIGADGGWDGRYEGPFMGLDGIWSFQSKWTKHDLDKAYTQLREELKRELGKAKKNKVQYLLLATNADLRVGSDDHIGKLEKLNENKKFVEHFYVWPRANLESRIIQFPWLRHYYFGDFQQPMFVPPHVFAESEPLLEGTLIGREESIRNLNDFINDSKSNVLIVHCGGGYGKTHFMVEAGKRCSSLQPSTHVWFCRPNRDVNEAINDELNHQKDYLIFLDDAERYLEDARKLITHTKTFSPGTLKVVLSCRSSGREIVKNLADSQRVDSYRVTELPPLPENELLEILTRTAGAKTMKHPERIVKELNGNLFLIVTTGKLIKGGGIDPGQLKKQIKDNLDHETAIALRGLLDDRDAKRLLRELSIIVPFSKDRHSTVIEKLSTVMGLHANVLSETLSKLIDAKILRTVGASVRFNPDMKGDIYLSVELDKENGKELINQIFENWLSVYPKQLTANLAAASRHGETDSTNEAVRELIKKWINEVSDTSDSLKSKRLELITPIAFLAPEETVSLIYAYIDSSNTDTIYGLNRDAYGPVIYQVLHIPGFEETILKLVLHIAQRNLKGTYSNYTPVSLIKQITSPIEVSISSAIKSLSEISGWTKKEDCTEIEAQLASEGAREALSGSHEHRESYGNQITFGRRILVYKEPFRKTVDQFRDKGMEVLKNLVFHPNDNVKKIGIEVVNDIGHEPAATTDEFWARILLDESQAIDWLRELVGNTTPHDILSSIEDVLIRHWANNNIYLDLSHRAADILRDYPRSAEYIVFRYFVAHDIVIAGFSDIEKEAPENDRWSWLVHNHFRLRDFKQGDLDNVVRQLSEKYKNKHEIIGYLKSLETEIEGVGSQWQYIPLIETWSKFNDEAFVEIIDDKDLLIRTPKRFHLGIYRVASDKDRKYIAACAEETLSDLDNLRPQTVEILLDLISRHYVSVEEFLPWLSRIIEKADGHLKHLILHRSYFIFKDRDQTEKEKVVEIIELALNEATDDPVLDMVDFLVHHAIQWNLPSDGLNSIRDKLFEIIKNVPSIDYHTDELLRFVMNGDLNKFIELVEYRLNRHRGSYGQEAGGRFDPIPFDGFRSAEGLIKNYTAFSQLMDKVNFWRRQELLYSFDLDNLLKKFRHHDDEDGDYLWRYIDDKIKQGDAENLKIAANALFGVPLSDATADLFLNLLLSADKVGVLDEAQDVFTHQVLSGGYSCAVGEAPPALVSKQEVLVKMRDKCPPGSMKNYVDSLVKSISEDIKRHLDEGEELMSPKA